MDSSILYMLGFIICLLLSWFLYKEYFFESILQYKIFNFINSGGIFSLYLFILLIMLTNFLIGMLRDKDITSTPIMDVIFSFVFITIGSVLFQFGFQKMSELQLIRNIPRSKIRAAAVGIVEIRGKIVSEYLLTTPYSKTQCIYFQCTLLEYRKIRDLESTISYKWEKVSSQTHKIPFWIKDETGQILVDPEGAEFKMFPSQTGYLNPDGSIQGNIGGVYPQVGDKKYIENFLSPNDELFVIGTVTIRKEGAKQQNVIQRGTNNSTFFISDRLEKHEVVNDTKWEMLAGIYYGIVIFITGFIEILHLSKLL